MDNIIALDPEERAFKDATSRFESIQNQLFKVENDLTLLIHLQKSLEENISVLKDRQIVPMLIEYRKAREDLSKVYNNMNMLRINRNNLEHSLEQAKKVFVDSREKYFISIETKRCRVIKVDFRSKNGR